MAQSISILKTLWLSILYGLTFGTIVAVFNGVIAGVFSSENYTNDMQSRLYIAGKIIAYSTLFALASACMVYMRIKMHKQISYLIGGVFMVASALYLRAVGASTSTLGCGDFCVDTIAPKVTQDIATSLVGVVLVVIYFVFVGVTLVLDQRERARSTSGE